MILFESGPLTQFYSGPVGGQQLPSLKDIPERVISFIKICSLFILNLMSTRSFLL